jgi:ferredoxin
MRVEIKRDKCVGAMACVVIDPEIFRLDEEHKAVLKKSDGTWTQDSVVYENLTEDQAKKIIQAAEACPVMAVWVWDDKGKMIYPK